MIIIVRGQNRLHGGTNFRSSSIFPKCPATSSSPLLKKTRTSTLAEHTFLNTRNMNSQKRSLAVLNLCNLTIGSDKQKATIIQYYCLLKVLLILICIYLSRQKILIYWFMPQMPTTASVEQSWNWEQRIQSGSPTWVAGFKYLSHHLLAPRLWISRKW